MKTLIKVKHVSLFGKKLHNMRNVKIGLRNCITSFYPQNNKNFLSIADGEDEDLMGIENIRRGQAPSTPVPEDYGLQTARGDQGAVLRAA